MPRAEAERRAATEAGFVSAADLYSALCRTWAARLASMKADEESTAGNKMLATALTFLRVGWGEKCLALGWREEDLFCLHPGAPWVRYDCMGRAYLAKQPVAVTADGIALRSGLRLRRYPSGDQGVLPWEDSRDDQDAGGGHG